MLEWISVYWFSKQGPAASIRIYYEMTGGNTHDVFEGAERTTVPFGASYFPGDLFSLPKSYVQAIMLDIR